MSLCTCAFSAFKGEHMHGKLVTWAASHVSHSSSHFSRRKAIVVYFDQLLGAARTQKLVETFFSAVFQPFLFISKLFSYFTAEIHKKTSENEQKT